MYSKPTQIILETSAACNLRCKGCAIHGPMKLVERPIGVMKEDIWKRVIKEIGEWDEPTTISLHGGGEPLLHPDFEEILGAARSYPKLNIGFLTNGTLFDERWAEIIIEQQIDWVAFSVDGVDPETFSQIRKGANLELVEKNIQCLLDLKHRSMSNKPTVSLNMVAYDEILDQGDAFVDKWVHRVDSVMVSHYRNPPSSKRWPGVHGERKPCPLLWSQAVVAWDGRVGLCCEDFNVDVMLGEVGQDDILTVWNGERMNAIRTAHINGHYNNLLLCAECDSWADGDSTQEVDLSRQYTITKKPSQVIYQSEKRK